MRERERERAKIMPTTTEPVAKLRKITSIFSILFRTIEIYHPFLKKARLFSKIPRQGHLVLREF
jgi:hypothetical protein